MTTNNQDIMISSTFKVPEGSVISNKPSHVVVLRDKVGVAKNAHNQCFISLDTPTMLNPAFIQAKGFYSDATEGAIANDFKEMIQTVDKSKIVETYIPWQGIVHINNLVFRAK